ncbi:hypothetical protein [Thauera sp.]|jgi:hypothetical protein|uniref:hypothetical protein n=1 Tax=Thauera sp. TaxID=1905334 RepID=UPI002605596D|nr:hypothetical protein [Thauera sp.]
MQDLSKTRIALLCLALLGGLHATGARAEALACPDLANATQVQPCPNDAELQYTYNGYCSDNARLYGRDVLTCASFENYKAAKNNALWEADGGRFDGYLSCNVGAETIKASKAVKIRVERVKTLTRVICDYENDHRMVHRTKSVCTVEAADCTSGECKANCK